jgi:hypothetical protein
MLTASQSSYRKARGLRLRCQPWSEQRPIAGTWPWNDSTRAPSACCSIAAPCHLPLHLSPSDGLHIEVALASANTKIVACRRYTMYQLLNYYGACQRKNRASSWNDCHPWIECLDSKSGIKNVFGFRACNFQHPSLASGRVVFSSCGADPSRAKNGLSAPN